MLGIASSCADDGPASGAAPKKNAAARVAADAGQGDAGACDTLKCACEQFCAKIDFLNCPADPTYDDCVSGCAPPDNHSCVKEQRDLAACRGAIPQLRYRCDPYTREFAVDGCEPEQEAFANCVFPP
jgi:hypothetical protein